jgi:hypothetical protein
MDPRDFTLLQKIQTGTVANPASYLLGTVKGLHE